MSEQGRTVTVNGTSEALLDDSLGQLLQRLGRSQTQGIAVALNDTVVPRSQWSATTLTSGDRIEIVVAVQEADMTPSTGQDPQDQRATVRGATGTDDQPLELAGLSLKSRLLLGTARYPSRQVLLDALEASGTNLVTVALRRVEVEETSENLYSQLRARGYELLPNTAGCFTVKDAVLTAELSREALGTDLIKLEVIADEETLLPDVIALLEAAEILVKSGFRVLPYTNDDPITARRLEDIGCAAVMPLAAPIGSGLGIRNPHNLALIRQLVRVPVIVDAGVGTASDVAIAFELGCDGVLLNSAVARARHPVRMARAIGHAALAGRDAFLAGRMPQRFHAEATSPLGGRIETRG